MGFLAEQPATDKARISVYAVGEGAIHAMSLAANTDVGAPKIHSLGLFQPLPGRYLDIITNRVRANGDPAALTSWLAAVDQVRAKGTVPEKLPEGLGAHAESRQRQCRHRSRQDRPAGPGSQGPAGTPVLLTCSDSDGQAKCDTVKPLIGALQHTALTVVELKGVNHVLREDPERQRRQLLEAGSTFSTTRQCARRVCRQVVLIWRHD